MMMVESLWWYMPTNPTTKWKPSTIHMKGLCLAIVWGVSSFQCHLYGCPYTLVTNHQQVKMG
jgi:hypothetical protein